MKQVLITLIAALALTAAAQDVEYADLRFTLDDDGRARNVHLSLPNAEFEAFNFTRVARAALGDEDANAPNLGSFLTLMAQVDWRFLSMVASGEWVIVLLERTTD